MCNFVLRPIKSYATIDVDAERLVEKDGLIQTEEFVVERGTAITIVKVATGYSVLATLEDGTEVRIPLTNFVHAFTANAKEVAAAKAEELKWFPAEKQSKEAK